MLQGLKKHASIDVGTILKVGDKIQIDKSAVFRNIYPYVTQILIYYTPVHRRTVDPTDMASIVGNHKYLLNLDSIVGNSE